MRHGKIKVVAMLWAEASDATAQTIRKGFGCLKGKIRMTPDFDAPLEDFKEYME